LSCAPLVPPVAPLRVGRNNQLLRGGVLGMLLVGGELPPPVLGRGRLRLLVGARRLLMLRT
jgi:hypothetical protein